MIDPSHLSGDGTVPPVYVEAVVADRKQYKPQEGLQLPPLTRDLQIGYTSPSFLIPQKVKFRYRLDGHDRDWQDAGTRREAFYTQLGPGKYRFRVIACNSNGVWNEAGATLDFALLRPTTRRTGSARCAWSDVPGVALWGLINCAFGNCGVRKRSCGMWLKPSQHLPGPLGPTAQWTSSIITGWNIRVCPRRRRWVQDGKPPFILQTCRDYVERRGASVACGEPFEHEVRFRRAADGEYSWFLSTAVPLRDAGGKIVKWYGISTDIEDRRRAENERERLRQLEADLAHVNRVSTLGEMAASLAHEIKQPIAASITSANSCIEWLTLSRPTLIGPVRQQTQNR